MSVENRRPEDLPREHPSRRDFVQAEAKLREAFAAAKVPAEIEVYGSLHGWRIPEMPKAADGTPIYNTPDAEKAWAKLIALYKSALA
jgi:carboxymethylenebutenolidase